MPDYDTEQEAERFLFANGYTQDNGGDWPYVATSGPEDRATIYTDHNGTVQIRYCAAPVYIPAWCYGEG